MFSKTPSHPRGFHFFNHPSLGGLATKVAHVRAPFAHAFAGRPSASAMDLAGHHHGMPRDTLMIGDMC